jgi:hypothetical protein
MSYVSYNENRIIPAPFYSIEKVVQKTSDATKVGKLFNIVLIGKLVADMGSPVSSGASFTGATGYPSDETVSADGRLYALQRKIEGLRNVFSNEGKQLKIQSHDSSTALTCYPRIVNLSFQEGLWFNTVDYRIALEADEVYGLVSDESFSEYISDASESWDISEGDIPKTYNVTHTINVVGKRFYSTSGTVDYQPWEYARRYAQSNLIGPDNNKFFASLLGKDGSGNSGLVDFDAAPAFAPYNFKRTERIDELGGVYNLVENWLYASGTAIEDYTIRLNHTNDDNQKTLIAALEGSVRGNYTLLSDYDTGYANALSYFNNVAKPNVEFRIWQVATGTYFANKTVNYDRIRGIINYSYEYDNRSSGLGYSEEYTISQNFDYSNYITTATIDGRIVGMLSDSQTDRSIKFTKAKARWIEVQPLLFTRVQTCVTGIANLRSTPTRKQVNFGNTEGFVQYSYDFNNRNVNAGTDDFNVSTQYSRDNGGITVVTVNGTIQGYDLTGSGNIGERYYNATQLMLSDSEMFTRAQTYATGLNIYNTILSKEITRSPNAGAISYAYQYSTEAGPCFANALSEVINVTEDVRGNAYASIFVLGRTNGPVLQSLGTTNVRRRTISIELVMPPFTGIPCDYAGGLNSKPNTTSIVNAVKPTGLQVFGEPGQESWNWKNGRYSFNQSFVYEV